MRWRRSRRRGRVGRVSTYVVQRWRAHTDRSPQPNEEDDADIYDEVSEQAYQSIVRGRMMEDDFIEDDDGSGYVDHGQDEWENRHLGDSDQESSEDEHEYFERTGRKKPKKSKRGKRASAAQSDYLGGMHRRQAGPQSDAWTPRERAPAAGGGAYRGAPPQESEAEFMSKLFGGLSSASTPRPAGVSRTMVADEVRESPSAFLSRKRKQLHPTALPALSHPRDSGSSSTEASSDPPEFHADVAQDVHVAGTDSPPWSHQGLRSDDTELPSSRSSLEERDAKKLRGAPPAQHAVPPEDDEEEFSFKAVEGKRENKVVNAMATKAQTSPKPAPSSPQPASPQTASPKSAPSPAAAETPAKLQSWQSVHMVDASSTPDVASSPAGAKDATEQTAAPGQVQCVEANRSVHFFWTDYYEVQGTIHLFGKVRDQKSGRFVSACVSVGGVERCVFLQPRERTLRDGHPTDMVPGEDEVYDEFDAIRSKHGIQSWLGKWVTRKYAFELPGVPAEGEYLKVKYGFDEPQLPMDLCGATFCRAFGTNTSAFELFVVKRRIMGPCWLKVTNASVAPSTASSWCKAELSVDDPKDVSAFADTDANAPKEPPPLTVMSVAPRSVVNYKENKREIVAVSARVWKDMALENPTPPEHIPSTSFTAVRPLGPSFPAGFENEARRGRTRISPMKYERMVLNSFLAQVHLHDPDVILSHEFAGTNLDILLHRMKELKCEHWSKLGRWRRAKWPLLKQGMNTRLLAGRLVCDLSSDTAKGMISSTTWSLSEMCRTYLNIQREEIDPDDVASYFDCTAPTPERLLTFTRHCEVDAFFQMAIASRVQLLPLTKQLTNLAGNAWTRTLNGGRAERNEYILLHEFHRKKYICPDKVSAWEKKALARAKESAGHEEHDEAEPAGAHSKKEKFKGGLVFEPKRGLWDKYVLVMDFNSLYPSIIQEFNIDFTTVDRSAANGAEPDQVPEVPSSDVARGVLPQLIATLVNRRRQVKSLMKDKSASATKQLQWNIKQQALKLTANSMYGCLGFENSRFYARPLAALTTFKGREILSTTRELAESMALDVIYGDTDSVMINTNCLDYSEALRIGNEFKRCVNERYKLLEIDIDGVFQRMLLLQKKKYAALVASENGETSTEIKGLDMKRREYCHLSKVVSAYVLDQILSGEPTEVVVEKIHEYLQRIGAEVVSGERPLDDFIIYKRLGKRPQDYPDAQNQPHVQVALRMLAKNESARSGDVIPYVFCLGHKTAESKATQAERAYHPEDVRRHADDPAYTVDYKHYLSLQILPPIERICESIEGTDRARLAECLGLDAHAYATAGSADASSSGREFVPLDSQIPSSVRYAHCEPLAFKCRRCGERSTFDGLAKLHAAHGARPLLSPAGFACVHCGAQLGVPSLVVQLELAIRAHIARYYHGWTECTEPSCGAVTRMAGVYSGRCLVHGCRGRVTLRFSDKDLYTQLCFYDYLFDQERALAEVTDATQRANLREMLQRHAESLEALRGAVQQYLARNGRRYVGLRKLFGFMRV